MTERCARDLAAEGVPLVLVNRTVARAEQLAASLADSKAGATATALDDFAVAPAAVEAVVCATGAEHAVLSRATLERMASRVPSGRALLAIDLAVPPDVDPDDAKAVGVERVGLDLLTARAAATREARLAAAAEARILVDQALDTWREDETERLLGPVLAAMQRHYQATAHAGVERLLRRDLAGLGDEQRDALERWAAALARRFAHLPASGLRAVVREHGGEALDAFLSRADDALGKALREAREDPS
jgi:glutamyl-tRNA reductase